MNQAEYRARIRQDLQDEDALNYRWTDDQIDGAVDRALTDISNAEPYPQQTDIATTAGSNAIDISSLVDLVEVVMVEYPIGGNPPYYQAFTIWGTTVYLESGGDGTDARIFWGKFHTVDTIPLQLEELVVLGATAYLAVSASVKLTDEITVGGQNVPVNYRQWAAERMDGYIQWLKKLQRKLRRRQLIS